MDMRSVSPQTVSPASFAINLNKRLNEQSSGRWDSLTCDVTKLTRYITLTDLVQFAHADAHSAKVSFPHDPQARTLLVK